MNTSQKRFFIILAVITALMAALLIANSIKFLGLSISSGNNIPDIGDNFKPLRYFENYGCEDDVPILACIEDRSQDGSQYIYQTNLDFEAFRSFMYEQGVSERYIPELKERKMVNDLYIEEAQLIYCEPKRTSTAYDPPVTYIVTDTAEIRSRYGEALDYKNGEITHRAVVQFPKQLAINLAKGNPLCE